MPPVSDAGGLRSARGRPPIRQREPVRRSRRLQKKEPFFPLCCVTLDVPALGRQEPTGSIPVEDGGISDVSDDEMVSDSDSGEELGGQQLVDMARRHEAAMFPACCRDKFVWMQRSPSLQTMKHRAQVLDEYDPSFHWPGKFGRLKPVYRAVQREAL